MDPLNLTLYCDESTISDSDANENWIYYGILIVPEQDKKELFTKLQNARCIQNNQWVHEGCLTSCGYHKRNNTEIHYKEISQDHEYRIANNWVTLVLDDCKKKNPMIYFKILGINRSLINTRYWRNYDKPDLKIYGRFLYAAIKGIKYFFPKQEKIVINQIIHDDADIQEDTDIYYANLAEDLDRDEIFSLSNPEIEFLSSDHRKSEHLMDSHFLQFIDLILGLSVNYIHCNSKRYHKKYRLTELISPLVMRLNMYPNNVNSSFQYYGKKSMSFFPKERVFDYDIFDLEGNRVKMRKPDLFYNNKRSKFEIL